MLFTTPKSKLLASAYLDHAKNNIVNFDIAKTEVKRILTELKKLAASDTEADANTKAEQQAIISDIEDSLKKLESVKVNYKALANH
jgi:hypothetical protein